MVDVEKDYYVENKDITLSRRLCVCVCVCVCVVVVVVKEPMSSRKNQPAGIGRPVQRNSATR